MTVEELIDLLMQVEDKSKVVEFYSEQMEVTLPVFDMVEHQDGIVLYDY